MNFKDELSPVRCRDLCALWGIPVRSEGWLKAKGVPIKQWAKNAKGRPSPLVNPVDLLNAVRNDQNGWTNWKSFEFECRWRLLDPLETLTLIVLCSAPDHELLKMVLNLCRDPECHLLFWLTTDDFPENTKYIHYSLEKWLGNELRSKMTSAVVDRYKAIVNAPKKRSFEEQWRGFEELVRQWPVVAADLGIEIYDGVLLLGRLQKADTPKEQMENFIIRSPSFITRFRESLKVEATFSRLPESLEKHFKRFRTSGVILPDWLLDSLQRFPLPNNLKLMGIAGIESYLKLAEEIDFGGKKMTWRHLNWKDVLSLSQAIMSSAAESGVKLNFSHLLTTIRSWNYRANLEREKRDRRIKRVDIDSVLDKDAARGEETADFARPLTDTDLRQIFGSIVEGWLRQRRSTL